MNDQWTAKLPNGKEVTYMRKELLSGRHRIVAQMKGSPVEHSRIIELAANRKDIETVFLMELI